MPANILVIDDDPVALQLIEKNLNSFGYNIRVATSGQEALDSIEKEPVDLVLLDLAMPNMNGFEVCKSMKKLDHSSDVPVIFVSAKEEEIGKVIAFELGAVDYVSKPISFGELKSRISVHLKMSAQRQRLRERIQDLHKTYEKELVDKKISEMERTISELKEKLEQYERQLKNTRVNK